MKYIAHLLIFRKLLTRNGNKDLDKSHCYWYWWKMPHLNTVQTMYENIKCCIIVNNDYSAFFCCETLVKTGRKSVRITIFVFF